MRKAVALSLFILVILSNTFLGCSFTKGATEEEGKGKKLNLPENIVSSILGDEINYYDLKDDSLEKLDLNLKGTMEAYSHELDLAIYREVKNKETYLIISDGVKEEKILVKGHIEELLVSPKGTKLLYRYNSGETIGYKILDLKTFKEFNFDENLAISGENVKFLDEEQLILYGVDLEKRKSGIYKYNIEKGEYSLEKPIEKAFIDYIDSLGEGNIFYEKSSIEGNKECYIYNLDKKEEKLISKEIKEINSLCKIGDKIYLVGSKEDGLRSLYSIDIESKKLNRLVYDFPKNLSENPYLISLDGSVYFLGFESEKENNALYKYNPLDRSVKLIDKDKGQFIIIK